MILRHDNATQIVKPVAFNPLLQNEGPYYNNLNRAPKNAYDYADSINKILSYGGYVSRIKPAGAEVFTLYNTVRILDGEVFEKPTSPTAYQRFGIIVAEKDTEGYYIVCTFCPNFVFPPQILSFEAGISDPGANITIDIAVPHTYLSAPSVGITGAPIVGKVTGVNTIFFTGTVRLFGVI